MSDNVSTRLSDNETKIKAWCENCDDIIIRPMRLGLPPKVDCLAVFIEVAVSNMLLEESMIGRLLSQMQEMSPDEIRRTVNEDGLGITDAKELATMEEAMAAMLAGNAIFFIDGYDKALKVSSKGYPGMGVSKSESEKVLRGSKEAFTESVKLNAALVRKRVRDTTMKIKERPIGKRSNTMTAIIYMEGLVYPDLLEAMEQKLDSFEIDGIMDSGVIEQLTEDTWYSPFPQYQTTERPDKAAMAVLDGRVVLLSDNSPEALILPTTINSFFQTSDDYYRHFGIVSFLRIIRFVAAFLAVSLPGLYVAVTNYHTQILPTNLILSLAEARQGVPFPSVIEVLLLELSFELLREAGVRMPGPIGNTIGIVGGLIIGQAAVSANLVSPIVVVIVALTALSSFSIPNEELSEALRLIKYAMILGSAFFGILGLVLGWFVLLTHLSALKSYNIPYLMPFVAADINQGMDKKDALVRAPLDRLKSRPVFARRQSRTRLKIK